jgi:uncharacterized protein (TIGR02145 family)
MASNSGWDANPTAGYIGNDQTSNNSSGFTALPGGWRFTNAFYHVGGFGLWWSFTEYRANSCWNRNVDYNNSGVGRSDFSKSFGLSIRCLRDTTSAVIPTLNTTTTRSITTTSANSGGTISSDGGALITSRGVCWNTTGNPTIEDSKTTDGTGSGNFTSFITGLTANNSYYVKAYATNSAGTAYGKEYVFKTYTGTATDIDGNIYNTVTIGTQVWMVENLKTIRYNDGSSIPNVTDNTEWGALTTPAYCFYNNDVANKNGYGALYNWHTVNTGKLAPTGWHVPTDAEWTTLTDYPTNNGYGYGGSGNDIAKSLAADLGWSTYSYPSTTGNDQASNNSSGYTGLPGGGRNYFDGIFGDIGSFGNWWSATENVTDRAFFRYLSYQDIYLNYSDINKQYGFSVRCVKN